MHMPAEQESVVQAFASSHWLEEEQGTQVGSGAS